jgi:hypothetical protein
MPMTHSKSKPITAADFAALDVPESWLPALSFELKSKDYDAYIAVIDFLKDEDPSALTWRSVTFRHFSGDFSMLFVAPNSTSANWIL